MKGENRSPKRRFLSARSSHPASEKSLTCGGDDFSSNTVAMALRRSRCERFKRGEALSATSGRTSFPRESGELVVVLSGTTAADAL